MAQLLPLTTLVVNLQLSVVYLIKSLVILDIQFSLILEEKIGMLMSQRQQRVMKYIQPLFPLELQR